MIVTQIEPFSKGKGRVSVYLNNEFAFVLYEGELSKYGINTGSELTSETYERILNDILILRAKKRGMNLLKTMDRTEADIRSKLREGGYPERAIDAAVEYLKSFGYVDDYRYASNYIHFKLSSMSRKQIYNKLAEKGISRDITESVFTNEYSDGEDSCEKELIRKLIIKKLKGNVEELDYLGRQKLFAYLYNKGFAISDIEKVYNDILLDITLV